MNDSVLDHAPQRAILLRLIHAPEMTFNELWAKEGASNKFAYHLHRLEEEELVHKNLNGRYCLTEEGRKLSAFVEGDTGNKAEFPTPTVIILAKQNGKYLCQKRLKEPFYGAWGFVSGKINFGYNLFECAQRNLLEESGLTANGWNLKAIEMVKTFEAGKLLHHHYLFYVETENPSGELKQRTHKAEHAWMTLEEYEQKANVFPRPGFKEHIIRGERPSLIETERFMENGRFANAKNTRVIEF